MLWNCSKCSETALNALKLLWNYSEIAGSWPRSHQVNDTKLRRISTFIVLLVHPCWPYEINISQVKRFDCSRLVMTADDVATSLRAHSLPDTTTQVSVSIKANFRVVFIIHSLLNDSFSNCTETARKLLWHCSKTVY